MFKYAQATRSAALEEEGIPAAQVSRARFRPSVRSVPLALGPAEGEAGGVSSHRPIVFIAVAIAALVILAFVLATLFGGGGDDPGQGPVDGASPSPQATMVATDPPQPTSEPTPQPEGTLDPDSSPLASAVPAQATIPVNYEVQEGEALLAIADKFGVSRRRILRANEGMDEPPYVEAGDIIIVPAAASLTIEELETIPGFLGLAE
jgi:LysM repeat protein